MFLQSVRDFPWKRGLLHSVRKSVERECLPSGWGHVYPTYVAFGSRRGISLACPVEAHAPVQYLGISQNLFFSFDAASSQRPKERC